jgi:hypothetical protein
MIRAGDLDRTLYITRVSELLDEFGAASDCATQRAVRLKAALLENHSNDTMQAWGAASDTTLIFRTWFISWVKAGDLVRYQGREFIVKEIKELGRRRGIELQVERVGQ